MDMAGGFVGGMVLGALLGFVAIYVFAGALLLMVRIINFLTGRDKWL